MDTWTDSPLPVDHCPVCGHAADVASTRSGAAPSPGDISACLAWCSATRRMTQAEFADLHPDNQDYISRRYD
jgi:hypothetical protein